MCIPVVLSDFFYPDKQYGLSMAVKKIHGRLWNQ